MLGASWLHEGQVLISRPMTAIAGLVEARAPEPIAAPVTVPMNAPVVVNDETQIKMALQRYRSAYEGLDARSARAVYRLSTKGRSRARSRTSNRRR